MLKMVQDRLYTLLNRRRDLSEDDLYKYTLMMMIAITAMLIHLFFVIFYSVIGHMPLAMSHVAGLFMFVSICLLLTLGMYDMSGVFLTVTVLLSTMVTVYIIGADNYVLMYQVAILVMQMIIPFSNRKIPIVFSVLIPIFMVLCFLYAYGRPPEQTLDYGRALSIINIFFCCFSISISLSLDRFVRNFLETFRSRRLMELEQQANVDPLTGLFNRRYADMYFERLQQNGSPPLVCAAIADIDDFKVVNDTYGHDAGDRTLIAISELFTQSLRKSDLIFRWGGEEFLLLVQNVSIEDGDRVLSNIREKVANLRICGEGCEFQVTITMGVSMLSAAEPHASIASCDAKLYKGKRSGKNQVVI